MKRRFSVSPFASAALFAAAVAVLSPPAAGQDKKGDKGGPKHVFAGPPPAHPFDVILARPTAAAITVSVLAYKATDVAVSYGTAKGAPAATTPEQGLEPGTPGEFVLADLKPATQYYYSVRTRPPGGGAFAADAERTFRTQRGPGGAFAFTVTADSHLDQATRPAVYERTLANALADGPDFHVDLGDTFMTDKYANYRDAGPQYYAQRYYFGRVAHSAPLFLVAGNHDGERLDRADGTADCMPVWACRLRQKLFPTPFPDGFYTGNRTAVPHVGLPHNYYAWHWGDALFIVLDPFWTTDRRGANRAAGNWAGTLGKDQYEWLRATLAGSTAKFKFVFIHHLVGGLDASARGGAEAAALYEWGGTGKDGKDEFAARRPGWEMPVHRLLVKHKVAAVFHGHDHFFAKQDLDGVVYLMVPQPGFAGSDRLRNADEYGYIRGDFLPPAGHVRVAVSPEKATLDYVRSYLPSAESEKRKNGDVAYTFTVRR